MNNTNPSNASVDLPLPMQGAAAAASASAAPTASSGGTPQALWAVAGAGLALVIGLAATAAVSDHQATAVAPASPAHTAGYASPPPPGARSADRAEQARLAGLPPAQRVAAADPYAAQAPVCAACGTVESVQAFKVRGRANGTGAVIGGVAGGVIGHEVGGNTAGTLIGAVGGGLLGHHIEKESRSHTAYRTQVRMDDGSVRTFTEGSARAVGSKVVVDNGKLKVASAQ